jgi:ankyrin repeat protein
MFGEDSMLVKDSAGNSVLHFALAQADTLTSEEEFKQMLHHLITNYPKLFTERNTKGETPLQCCVANNMKQLVCFPQEDPGWHVINAQGNTIFHQFFGKLGMFAGQDYYTLPDHYYQHFAKIFERSEILKLLQKKNLNSNTALDVFIEVTPTKGYSSNLKDSLIKSVEFFKPVLSVSALGRMTKLLFVQNSQLASDSRALIIKVKRELMIWILFALRHKKYNNQLSNSILEFVMGAKIAKNPY